MAYDNVRKNVLINELQREKYPRNLMNYNQWMKDKKTKFVISQEVEWRIVNKGLPQGGVLKTISLILYAIYTNKIYQGVEYRCQVLQHADDIVVYSAGTDKVKSIKEVEIAIERIEIWRIKV